MSLLAKILLLSIAVEMVGASLISRQVQEGIRLFQNAAHGEDPGASMRHPKQDCYGDTQSRTRKSVDLLKQKVEVLVVSVLRGLTDGKEGGRLG